MRFGLTIFCLLLTLCSGHAADVVASDPPLSESAKVDRLFDRWDKPNSPGCAVAIMRDGTIIYERGYGMADLDHDIPITPKTVFQVGSVSKQFTAMAVLLLAAEGKLSLDDPAKKYVPEVPDVAAAVTIRQLLNHTSGLRDYFEMLGLDGWRAYDLITDDDILKMIARQQSLNFEPGSRYLYSNTNYFVLAQIVRVVSGVTLRKFTTDRLFQPLQMTHSFFRDNHAETVKNLAAAYIPANKTVEKFEPWSDTVGATNLLTTVEDLALWDENFYTHVVGDQAVAAEIQTRGHLNDGTLIDYAAGLEIGFYRGLYFVEHDGVDGGFRAELIRFPAQHFSVAALCNFLGINPAERVRKIADIYLASVLGSKTPSAPGEATATPSVDRLASLTGVYVEPETGFRELRISFVGGKLRGGIIGVGDELVAIRDTHYRYVAFPSTELEFSGGQNGEPMTLTSFINHKIAHHYQRVARSHPTPDDLQPYVATYRSTELDEPIVVSLTGSHLTVAMRKKGTYSLNPVAEDFFDNGIWRFKFTRGPDGKLDGLLLNSERSYRVKYTRAADQPAQH